MKKLILPKISIKTILTKSELDKNYSEEVKLDKNYSDKVRTR